MSLLAPFTVPLASLLAIPMLSSWSTSLNLVFLSLAWTTIAATYSPLQLEAFAPLFLRLTLYIFPSLVFLLFDIGVPSLSAELKSQSQLGIATKQKGGSRKMWRVVGWSVLNVLLAVAIQAAVEFLVTDVFRMRSLCKWTPTYEVIVLTPTQCKSRAVNGPSIISPILGQWQNTRQWGWWRGM
jgi:hypothetical protein